MSRPLKALMAVSADGYVCRGPYDDMSWTGSSDKKVFKLLTHVEGILGIGQASVGMLPRLSDRRVITLSRTSKGPDVMDLDSFAGFRGAWLIGGQTIVRQAVKLGYVEELFLCRVDARLGSGVREDIVAHGVWRGCHDRHVVSFDGCSVRLFLAGRARSGLEARL